MSDTPSENQQFHEIKEFHKTHLTRIQELSFRLFERKYQSPKGLWNIQIDLVNYQIELREGIRKENSLKKEINQKISEIRFKETGDWKSSIKEYQNELKKEDARIYELNNALKLARKFGDAFAWLFFEGDDKKITPLSRNKPNPGIPDEISFKAMLGVAESFYRGGAGFPVIHDATNFLRIGDITFCDLTNKNDQPLTIEVKASVLSTEGNTAKLSVKTFAIAPQPKFLSTLENINEIAKQISETQDLEINSKPESEPNIQAESKIRKRTQQNDRLNRQVKRMAEARQFQNTKHGNIIENEDNLPPILTIGLKLKHSNFHWNILHELANEAKKTGFASRPVDDAFVYCISYTDEPIRYAFAEAGDLPSSEKFTEALKQIPQCSDSGKNLIYFTTSFKYFEALPPHIRPFFWYEIPTDLRIDILWGRLFIMVAINVGKIVEKLQENGINARLPKDGEELASVFIPITSRFTHSNGEQFELHITGLKEFADKIGYEFFSLDGFIDAAKQMINSSMETVKKQPEIKQDFSKTNLKNLSKTKSLPNRKKIAGKPQN